MADEINGNKNMELIKMDTSQPIDRNNIIVPKTKFDAIVQLFHRIGDGIRAVYGDFRPAINKVANMLGTKAENIERQMILKRNYTESEAAIFYNFLSDFVKKYAKTQKQLRKELDKIQTALGKAHHKSEKQIRMMMKDEDKTNKLSMKLGRGGFEGRSNAELGIYWRKEYSTEESLEQQFRAQKMLIEVMIYEFNYVFRVLEKHYRRNPELVREITVLHGKGTESSFLPNNR